MKARRGCLARIESQRLCSVAIGGCLLVPLLFIAVVRPGFQPFSFLNLQAPPAENKQPAAFLAGDYPSIVRDSGEVSFPPAQQPASSPQPPEEVLETAAPPVLSANNSPEEDATALPPFLRETDGSWLSPYNQTTPQKQHDAAAAAAASPPLQQANSSQLSDATMTITPEEAAETVEPPAGGENEAPTPTADGDILLQPEESEASPEKTKLVHCDYSHDRTEVCEIPGEVRIQGSSASVFAVAGTADGNSSSWKIRPYARKWETSLMPHIKEYTVTEGAAPPPCSVQHGVPAVVFSTGGLLGNFFHDLSDVLIPLFLTVHRYNGEVQFFVTQYNAAWFEKYGAVLRLLSRYEAITGDGDARTHCFPSATVGLWSHSELSIFPNQYPADGISMTDFRRVLRSAYSLKREFPRRLNASDTPRMLFLSRRESRSLLNEREVIALARKIGFKVIVAPPAAARNMKKFAKTVNSCDVLMGVHGAGLTNMVFLPTNATMVQVIPWGELKYACRFAYGDPAVGMGMKYLEYEVGKEETSLKYRYPKDHPVFTDPLSIHRQGYAVVWDIFISHQNVTLDLRRFRPFLLKTLEFVRK